MLQEQSATRQLHVVSPFTDASGLVVFSLSAVHVSLLCNFSWGSDGDFFPFLMFVFFVQFQICNRSIVIVTYTRPSHTGWKARNFSSLFHDVVD